MPLLSIIIPTFNSEKLIRDCLDNVKAQTFTDYEVLIIDGNSTDSTMSIVKEYSLKHPFMRWISEPDKGIYDAMNKAVNLANGEWVYFLGSDDELVGKDTLRKIFIDHSNIVEDSDLVYGNVLWGDKETIYNGRYDVYELFRQNICHQAIFVKKKNYSTKSACLI